MERLIERCAGLDVHKSSLTACVRKPGPGGGREQETRTFSTTRRGLLALLDWLRSYQVELVGMESTGVYWRAVYYLLEDHMECWLLNAQHLRHVPGRKSDVRDAEWICQLLEHGLVRPSFVPPREIRELRDLTRYRKAQIEERTREVQRLDKTLQDAGIKLSSVASEVLSVSGRAMLEALISGTHDPDLLAELARGRLRAKLPALREALEGRFTGHHALIVGQILAHIDFLDESIETLSHRVEELIAPFSKKRELLCTIPGVSRRTAESLLAEIGTDMEPLPTHRHLASWAGMCPGQNESAGKQRSAKTRKRSKWLRSTLRESAKAASRTKGSYPSAHYTRIKGRRGHARATVATGHSILVSAYYMLQRDAPYQELGELYFHRRQQEHAERYQHRLVRQLERLGHKVTPEPLPDPARRAGTQTRARAGFTTQAGRPRASMGSPPPLRARTTPAETAQPTNPDAALAAGSLDR
jgi:transposase